VCAGAGACENYEKYYDGKVDCDCSRKHACYGSDGDKCEIEHAIKPGKGFGHRFGQAEIFGGILCGEM
jgi:hypothetical protein